MKRPAIADSEQVLLSEESGHAQKMVVIFDMGLEGTEKWSVAGRSKSLDGEPSATKLFR